MNTMNNVAKFTFLAAAGCTIMFLGAGWGPQDSKSASGESSTAAAPAQTEDIIYTTDGRELHGRIVSETRTEVVFEFVDQKTKIKSTLKLQKDQIAEIKKGVPVQSAAPATPATADKAGASSASDSKSADKTKTPEKSRGFVTKVGKDAQNVPAFYVVPIKGQVGTDVISEVYKDVVDDIKAVKPNLVIIRMDCKDKEQSFAADLGNVNPREIGLLDIEDGRNLVAFFHEQLRDIPQVVWTSDSMGMSSVIAMSWKDIYMTPSARLGGMAMVLAQSGAKGWPDPDVRAKMYAAWTGGAKSIMEYGGYSQVLADAMIDPEFMLSATWRGREVLWTLDTNGEYIVDADDERPSNFTSKMCEDFCISKGTAENLDDLALLMGYREYKMADGKAEKLIGDYITDWRRAFGDAMEALEKFDQYMGWANGADQVKYLGQAKAQLERVLSALNRYKAVEKRLRSDVGVDKMQLTLKIEEINQTLREIKNNSRTGGGGGRTSGGGRAGSGGGGREGG